MKMFDRVLLFLTLMCGTIGDNKLRLVKEWNELDFIFPDDQARSDAMASQQFIRGNSLPLDVDVYYEKSGKHKILVTVPRFDIGRPFTLARIIPNEQRLVPYPDFSWQNIKGNNCNGLTSVFRIAIDECSRLWVLDTGKIGDDAVCPAKLVVFDLRNDQMIRKHEFRTPTILSQSLPITPVVDVRDSRGSCRDTFVYIADVSGFGLIVYDYANDASWRVENKLFYPHPPYGTFNIAGETFDLMDGAFGLALSPLNDQRTDRYLYFHALASITENFVKTSVLRNATAWIDSSTVNPRDFQVFQNKRNSQTSAQAMDKNGILFFGLLRTTSIGCWNSNSDYAAHNMDVVAKDPVTLQFPSGLKIVNNLKGEQELWVLTCRFQKVMTGTMTTNEVNFRIQAGKVSDLVRQTRCSPNGAPPRFGEAIEHIGSSNSGDADLN